MERASASAWRGEKESSTSSSGVEVIPEWQPIEEPKIPKAVWYVVPVVILGAGLGGYLYYTRQPTPPRGVKTAPPPAPAAEPAPPAIAHPIPEDGDAARPALPMLSESDA